MKEILTGKYGDDTKLIYDLEEQEGERLSLRYDLTVPLARFLAKYKTDRLKCYQIDAIHRRDQPTAVKGQLLL